MKAGGQGRTGGHVFSYMRKLNNRKNNLTVKDHGKERLNRRKGDREVGRNIYIYGNISVNETH